MTGWNKELVVSQPLSGDEIVTCGGKWASMRGRVLTPLALLVSVVPEALLGPNTSSDYQSP